MNLNPVNISLITNKQQKTRILTIKNFNFI